MTQPEQLHIAICADRANEPPRVLAHACALAAVAGARLSLVHIMDPGASASDQASAADQLSRLPQGAGASGTPRVAVREDGEKVSGAIARTAARLPSNLIALDSRDLSMARHVIRGSTAMEVLSAVKTPLMVAGSKVEPPRSGQGYHLAIALDGSATSEAIFSSLGGFLELPGLQFTLVQVYEPRIGDQGELQEMQSCDQRLATLRRRFPATANVDCRVSRTEGLESVPHAILRMVDGLHVDALAMATQGETAARHVLVGSVALAVTQHSPLPVILTRG